MERSDTLESQPGLAGNDENVSKVFFFLLEMLTMFQRFFFFKGCGESVIDRIIGGETTEGKEVPWMCAILRLELGWDPSF